MLGCARLASLVTCVACLTSVSAQPALAPTPSSLSAQFQREADALRPHVRTRVAQRFLETLPHLPGVAEGRVIRLDRATRDAMSQRDYDDLPEADPRRDVYEPVPIDDAWYYTRLFGTPALYARTLDVASAHGLDALDDVRLLDFGFGHVGHLRALAMRGVHSVGVEVNPIFEAMYSAPEDTGFVPRFEEDPVGSPPGSVRLIFGSWPGDREIRRRVGGRYDVIITKNVLKRGYIHPEREADPSQLIDLGVDDATFLGALHGALVPGGIVVIYNYAPEQASDDEPYLPWADGRCPFDEEELREAGFEVLAFDEDDTPSAVDHFVGVGAGDRASLEGTIFATYTVFRRPVE